MMRITTQMLDRTAKRTGIPVNQNSLLSYINNTSSSTGNTLLDSLKKNNKVSAASTEHYKKLEKTADDLASSAKKLEDNGKNSLYEKARESGSNEELYESVESFVSNYNAALSGLGGASDQLSIYYRQMMQEAVDENSSALENIGITSDKNGKLAIDSSKLKNASVDDIEKAFASGTLTSKASFLAGKIANNAQANVQSASSQYDQYGNLLSQMTGRYDFWS